MWEGLKSKKSLYILRAEIMSPPVSILTRDSLNLPSGLVFYLDFKYGTSVGKFTAGDDIIGKQGPNSPSGALAPYGEDTGFYGAGRYGYSSY